MRIEGARANPTWSTVRKIATGLNVRVSEIADLADDLDPTTPNRIEAR